MIEIAETIKMNLMRLHSSFLWLHILQLLSWENYKGIRDYKKSSLIWTKTNEWKKYESIIVQNVKHACNKVIRTMLKPHYTTSFFKNIKKKHQEKKGRFYRMNIISVLNVNTSMHQLHILPLMIFSSN